MSKPNTVQTVEEALEYLIDEKGREGVKFKPDCGNEYVGKIFTGRSPYEKARMIGHIADAMVVYFGGFKLDKGDRDSMLFGEQIEFALNKRGSHVMIVTVGEKHLYFNIYLEY